MVAELYALMLADLAVTLAYLGYIDQARSRLNEALSEARRIRHAETLAEVLLRANWIAAITGSPEMQRQAEELLTVSTEYGFPMFLGWAKAFHGKSLTALGQAHKGLTLLTQGLEAVRATGTVTNMSLGFMWLAEACAIVGRPADGLNCLAEARRGAYSDNPTYLAKRERICQGMRMAGVPEG
jgi:hypothetical protein